MELVIGQARRLEETGIFFRLGLSGPIRTMVVLTGGKREDTVIQSKDTVSSVPSVSRVCTSSETDTHRGGYSYKWQGGDLEEDFVSWDTSSWLRLVITSTKRGSLACRKQTRQGCKSCCWTDGERIDKPLNLKGGWHTASSNAGVLNFWRCGGARLLASHIKLSQTGEPWLIRAG